MASTESGVAAPDGYVHLVGALEETRPRSALRIFLAVVIMLVFIVLGSGVAMMIPGLDALGVLPVLLFVAAGIATCSFLIPRIVPGRHVALELYFRNDRLRYRRLGARSSGDTELVELDNRGLSVDSASPGVYEIVDGNGKHHTLCRHYRRVPEPALRPDALERVSTNEDPRFTLDVGGGQLALRELPSPHPAGDSADVAMRQSAKEAILAPSPLASSPWSNRILKLGLVCGAVAIIVLELRGDLNAKTLVVCILWMLGGWGCSLRIAKNSRPLRLWRRRDSILGLDQALPFGVGRIRVMETEHVTRTSGSAGSSTYYRYRVDHGALSEDGQFSLDAVLFDDCSDPVRTRSFAETLCRLGRYSMEWVSHGEVGGEVRSPDALDEPLSARLARDLARTRPSALHDWGWKATWTESGVVLRAPRGSSVGLWLVFLPFFIAVPALGALGGISGFLESLAAVVCIFVILGLSTATWGEDLGRSVEIQASPEGISERRVLLGHTRRARRVPASKIEEIHYELRVGEHMLAVVGDGVYRHTGQFVSFEEANWARSVLMTALLGQRPSEPGGAGLEPKREPRVA